ncbi:MAG: glycerate kinase [Bdellovibrionaceae bacterium]|nr:glycerate kinase [Bdellovibrionales bacterium]MCB9253410.1 glycerate kinase [Pseudobdellovibrionaceae bacterium]
MNPNSKKPAILVALNPFKGTLSNEQACQIVAEALQPRFETSVLPIGDGGRGTLFAVKAAIGGEIFEFAAKTPMGKPTQARVLALPSVHAPTSIYIESAEVCGLHLVPESERDVLRASSNSLGTLMLDVLQKWPETKRIYVGLGDSATSDAGMGMLDAFGFKFTDNAGKPIWGNGNGLRWIEHIVPPKSFAGSDVEFVVLCDVLNPLCGPDGSARVFSPQKGASEGQVALIEQGMENFATRAYEILQQNIKLEPMTGAAGGIAAAFRAFFRARLVQGAQFLLDWLHFDEVVRAHQVVITGEGRTDAQTFSGKAPYEVIRRASSAGVKSLVVSGSLGKGLHVLKDMPSVLGCYATAGEGSPEAPDAALREKISEIFSDPEFLKKSKLEV